jgi:L-aspartate oxidase
MRRYITGYPLSKIPAVRADVVIAGCGAAGLWSALNLDAGLSCAVLCKTKADVSNSMYAQGGVAAVVLPSETDSPERHFRDTVAAGAGLCDENAVRILTSEADGAIKALLALGVPFDRQDGQLMLTREGGHGQNRILHSGGDATGLHVTRHLLETARQRENITFYEDFFLTDILTGENGVTGVVALDEQGRPVVFTTQNIVIASGGIGRAYQNSTNAVCATGDGIAAAARAGAQLADMEFVQFHPTALTQPDADGRYFLISEALRGEGAVLKNAHGTAFMQGVHPLSDLAPRDIVARQIARQMKTTGEPWVYLDITHKPARCWSGAFPRYSPNACAAAATFPSAPCPSCRCSTISWAASKRTPTPKRTTPAFLRAVKARARACTVQTALRATRCLSALCSGGAAQKKSVARF